MKRFNLWIDEKMYAEIKEQSRIDNRTVAGSVRTLITEYLEKVKKKKDVGIDV